MPLLPIPIPAQDAFVQKDGVLTEIAIKFLQGISDKTTAASRKLGEGVSLSDQSASISATPIYSSVIPAGAYRLSYYIQVTRAAGTSSTLTVAFAWESFGQGLAKTYAALTTNTLLSYQSDSVFIRSDANSPITYDVTYGSVGAPTMQYHITVILEQVSA